MRLSWNQQISYISYLPSPILDPWETENREEFPYNPSVNRIGGYVGCPRIQVILGVAFYDF